MAKYAIFLSVLAIALRARIVLSITCPSGDSTCSAELADSVCEGAGTNCVCDINHTDNNGVCDDKACIGTDGSTCNATDNNVQACDNLKCACIANYAATDTTCTQIPCTVATSSDCTDTNARCDATGDANGNCVCKENFEGASTAACTRVGSDCVDDTPCAGLTNSVCHSGTGCDCNTLYTADATTGVCSTQKTCSVSGIVTTTCGTNTACELLDGSPDEYKCACLANYSPSAAGCRQTECTVTNVATDCGTNFQCVDLKCACPTNLVARGSSCQRDCSSDTSVCDTDADCVEGACFCKANFKGNGGTGACTRLAGCSTTDLTMCHPNSKCSAASSGNCLCADTYTTSGTLCKKDCSSNSTACHANAACTSNVCQCNVNYEGDGATCTQKTCTGTDVTSCHANSKCVSDKCQCANNFEPSGQTCVACPSGWAGDGTVCKKTCASDTECGPTTAVCTSSACECATNYDGNGTSCTVKTCTANSDCTTANNYTCTSGSCACADGYSFSSTERDCIMNAGGIIFYSLSLMMAALLLSIFTSKI